MSRRALLWSLLAHGASLKTAASAEGFIELRASPLSRLSGGGRTRGGFNDTTPGPLLRASQGQEFKVRIHNELEEGIAVHWQGIRLANSMDGTALTQPPILPGRFFDYRFTPPDAGTFCYRATAGNSLERARGLHGMLVVDGEADAELELFDIPLILDELWARGNGASRPVIHAPAGKTLRLRMLNSGDFGALRLVLAGEEARIIAYDGQPADPVRLGAGLFEIWPGQRLDIAVPPSVRPLELSSFEESNKSVRATIISKGRPAAPSIAKIALKPNPLPDYFNYAASRQVTLTIERAGAPDGSWTVNGRAGLSPEPLFSVPRGTTVALTIDNISRSPHALHIHGHAARLIERAGRAIEEPVWRDTFLSRPLEPVKILFIADNPGRWLIAGTLAKAFDRGLQTWFEVK